MDIYRTFHPNIAEHTFVSADHVTFSKEDNMIGHKAAFKKYRKIETSHYILYD